jgi:hypothetical protein
MPQKQSIMISFHLSETDTIRYYSVKKYGALEQPLCCLFVFLFVTCLDSLEFLANYVVELQSKWNEVS